MSKEKKVQRENRASPFAQLPWSTRKRQYSIDFASLVLIYITGGPGLCFKKILLLFNC